MLFFIPQMLGEKTTVHFTLVSSTDFRLLYPKKAFYSNLG